MTGYDETEECHAETIGGTVHYCGCYDCRTEQAETAALHPSDDD